MPYQSPTAEDLSMDWPEQKTPDQEYAEDIKFFLDNFYGMFSPVPFDTSLIDDVQCR